MAPWLLRLMVLQVVLQVPWLAGYSILAATNKHREMVFAYIVASVLGLAAAVLLMHRWGVIGVPIGLMLGEVLFCSPIVLRRTCQETGESFWAVAARIWLLLAVIFSLTLAAGYGVQTLLVSAPFVARAAVVGILAAGVAGSLSWLLWLQGQERNRMSSALTHIFRPAASASTRTP